MRRFVATAFLISTTMLSGSIAYAQNAAATSLNPEAMGEIVVTAQRRSENVLKVPLAVTVVSGTALSNAGVNNLASLTSLAPSLQTANDDTYSIRGVGTTTFSPTIEPTVSQVVDDVVLGNATFAAAPFYDVQRVEVLNGPQGLLFGKNASAGLVNITTARPILGEFHADAEAEGVNRYRPGGDGYGLLLKSNLNIPLGQTSAIRISGVYNTQDSIVRQVAQTSAGRNDINLAQGGGRIKFLSEPSDALSIYLIGDYITSRGAAGFTDVTLRSLGAGSPTQAALTNFKASYGIVPSPTNLQAASDAPTYRDVDMGGASANLAYKLQNGIQLSSITAWRKLNTKFQIDGDTIALNAFNLNANATNYEQFSQELRATLPADSRLSGQGGLYYFHATTYNAVNRGGLNLVPPFVAVGFPFCIGATVTAGPPPACSTTRTNFLGQDSRLNQTTDSYAVFGQLSYKILETVKATAGGRFTRDEATLALRENMDADSYFVTLGVPKNTVNTKATASNFSYKIGLDWQATPTTLIYGFYGRGYKGPGFSNSSAGVGVDVRVAPEISNGGEIGLKGSLLGRSVTYSVSAFYTKFQNLQVQSWNNTLQTFSLQNAATATSKGVDLSLTYRPARDLSFSGNASILDATYGSYAGVQCYVGQVSPTCTNGYFNAAGLPILLSAKFSSSMSMDYTPTLRNNLKGMLGLGLYHRSSYLSGFSPSERLPEVTRIDARIGLQSDNWTAALFCKNCFNVIQPFSIGQYPGDTTNGVMSTVQRFNNDSVRTIGLRFTYKH
ncbi:iron complex outermembrane receptor protein [Novosphingobium sp. SG751A]|uniref:TonB-dependent receptor n=1 Tax=Novosphingobium sp. SG751A TaxID=2587000 RepID=UPI001556001C|nr:TonB-dependent receptor [Novosphingobium sp. SG751A]NOW48922.1 iron complex outermembrane receptor protein [Novosphingobium sp. SG751A]